MLASVLSSENNIHVIMCAIQCKRSSCTDGRASMQSTPNDLLRTDRNTASRFSMSLQAASFLLPNNGDTDTSSPNKFAKINTVNKNYDCFLPVPNLKTPLTSSSETDDALEGRRRLVKASSWKKLARGTL